MYDIESDKVRRLVAKYLIGKGCTRIQRSIPRDMKWFWHVAICWGARISV
ncbi:CRISPR-associated endonuclease Cas2 [Porphyromonas uenonis]|nr:CRISPR-associated endonuclease Cas2 [Porphyromonas uenonis]